MKYITSFKHPGTLALHIASETKSIAFSSYEHHLFISCTLALHIADQTRPVALLAILTRKIPLLFRVIRIHRARNQVDNMGLIIFQGKYFNDTFSDINHTHMEVGKSKNQEIVVPKINA